MLRIPQDPFAIEGMLCLIKDCCSPVGLQVIAFNSRKGSMELFTALICFRAYCRGRDSEGLGERDIILL